MMPLMLALNMAVFKTVGTLMFVAVFLGVVVWLVVARSDRYEKTEQIPLHDDVVLEPRAGAGVDDADKATRSSGNDPHG
ncbi:MAG: cbb3-type cytochrome oxidase subunit 3 [Phycisphaerales bacterium JB038]